MAAATVNAVGSSASRIDLTVTNPNASGTVYRVEANRARDFSSDDTLFFNIAAPNGTSTPELLGLPSGTTWFVRLINVTTGEISNVAAAATFEVTLNSAYTGYSVDKALLVVPEEIPNLSLVAGTAVDGYPVSNLLVDSPSALMRTSNNIALNFDTSGAPIDIVVILGTLINDDGISRLRAFTDSARTQTIYDSGTVPFRVSQTIGRRPSYHGLYQLPTPVTARYWQLGINANVTSSLQMIARHLIVGRGRQSVNASMGTGAGLNDFGTAARTRFGDPDRVLGWRGRTIDFELSWLSEREYQTKWADLPQLVGTTKSVLVIPNSKRNVYLNDRIGYGTITDWRGENVRSSKHSVSIAVNSLY